MTLCRLPVFVSISAIQPYLLFALTLSMSNKKAHRVYSIRFHAMLLFDCNCGTCEIYTAISNKELPCTL